jgi:hypothetical protein
VLSRTSHSNPLLSSTKEPTQTSQNTQGALPHIQDLSPIIRWEEEEEEFPDVKPSSTSSASSSPAETLPRKRKLIWWSDRPSRKKSEPEPQPHPLRTDVWKLKVQWRQQHFSRQNKKHAAKKEMLLEFADNGYVRLCTPTPHDDSDTAHVDEDTEKSRATTATTPIGTWKLDPSGLSWHLPLHDGTEHYFFADIHINPFGEYPKMTRGIVIRERRQQKSWFRPIVATFVGTGVGADTADFSYKHRNFGLSQAEQTDDR